MLETLISIYQSLIFTYALTITICYVVLASLAYYNIVQSKIKYTKEEEDLLHSGSERVPGISVIAPAYNESVIIIDNVSSLLNLDYPIFEVVIVNDGSTDNTLELLIDKFNLEEIPFPYIEKIRCRPVKNIYQSTNPKYNRLTIVNKVNGGTKADAMNAGINVAKYPYIINTDVDGILAQDTLSKVILPVLDSKVPVIAVGATMRMSNGCEVTNGVLTRVKPPKEMIATFQETEYLRSYLVSKMGWSLVNAIPNISGGFGLFDRLIVINAGGFDPKSHAEDMDMTIRLGAYMRSRNKEYRIVQIPDTCCWTEGPSTVKILQRQRTRWGRGLLQIFVTHRELFFNRKYGRIGLTIIPYALFFEFLAPIIEFAGVLFMIYLLFTSQINFDTLWLMLLFVFITGTTMSLITVGLDMWVKKQYNNFREYFKLILFTSLEAFIYHPMVVVFTLQGYWQFLTRKEFKWGTMTRQGFSKGATDEENTILEVDPIVDDPTSIKTKNE